MGETIQTIHTMIKIKKDLWINKDLITKIEKTSDGGYSIYLLGDFDVIYLDKKSSKIISEITDSKSGD